MSNRRVGFQPRRRKRRVPLGQEKGPEIEGEFMLTGGRFAEWYESWSRGREKEIAVARERARKKARAKQLAQLTWAPHARAARQQTAKRKSGP